MRTLEDIEENIRQLTTEDRERLERWFYTHPFSKDGEEWRVAEPAAAYKIPLRPRQMSVDDYLEFEMASPAKHEYVAGAIFAMTGVSRRHNRLTTNLTVAVGNHLRGGPREVFVTEFKLKLRIDQSDIVYYPDLMVTCGREGIHEHYLDNPKLIVEVLSPSTARTDRREKSLNYRQIATVEEYALVAQDKPEVTIYRRSAQWQALVLAAAESIVEFHSIGLAMRLQELYEGV